MNKTGRGLKELLEENFVDINDIKDGEVVLEKN